MADYYSILKKTVSGLPRNTAENRKIVYGKARQAIDRQLRSLSPVPSDEAIAKQMTLLEQAIDSIEAEFSAKAAHEARAEPAVAAPARPPQPGGRPVSAPPASQAPASAGPASAALARAPERAERADAAQQRTAGHDRRPSAAQTPAAQPPAPQPSVAARVQPERAAPTAAARVTPRATAGAALDAAPPRPEPARARPAGAATEPAYDATLDALDEFDRRPEPSRRQERAAGEAPRRGSGHVVRLAILLAVLGLVGVGGYALWLNKEPLMAALGLAGDRAGEPVAGGEAAPSEEVPAGQDGQVREAGQPPADGKEDVRLSQSGETVPGKPVDSGESEPATAAPSQPPVREAGETGPSANVPAQEGAGGQAVQVNPVGDGQQPGASGEQAGTAAPAAQGEAARPEPSAPPAIAQKAFLYEEGSAGGAATRDNAAIVWTLAEEPPGDGLPAEAVIKGQFDVPGRGLTMQIIIKRNTDEALPASHIVELLFDTPPDFSGGNIDNVARIVLKSSEQARGEGLIAVPAKIDTGYFLIALNNLAQAVETNRKLLTESAWIDIPVGYTSGRRALVTLEKGAIGDKVFRDAFADWEKR